MAATRQTTVHGQETDSENASQNTDDVLPADPMAVLNVTDTEAALGVGAKQNPSILALF